MSLPLDCPSHLLFPSRFPFNGAVAKRSADAYALDSWADAIWEFITPSQQSVLHYYLLGQIAGNLSTLVLPDKGCSIEG